MQGRLLPKYQGRYQAHPVNYWEKEFPIAKELGLECIEFILDFNEYDLNPLTNSHGLEKIEKASKENDIKVYSVCADYFMESPLHNANSASAKESIEVLKSLIKTSSTLGVKNIVLPCVDQSSLNNQQDKDLFIRNLSEVIPIAEEKEVFLSLETDLAPKPFRNLLNQIHSSCIKVNYDIGNSAALGYNLIDELNEYGQYISDIHIKDRRLNGSSVFLGKGNANFELFFDKLLEYDYQGIFIMQAYRDEEGVEIFKRQLDFVKTYLN